MEEMLIQRAKADPKPLYYDEEFLAASLATYLAEQGLASTDEMEPDDFVQWVFPRLIVHRRPLYERIAEKYGYTVDARLVQDVRSEQDVLELIGAALEE
jgi:hypothetical protein